MNDAQNNYRKKPVVVQAVQYTEAVRDACLFDDGTLPDGVYIPRSTLHPTTRKVWSADAYIDTLEGCMEVSIGDWIITGIKGEHYPCKPDIFAATYEPEGAALAASPEPVTWQYRTYHRYGDPGWGPWWTCNKDEADFVASKPDTEVRALYATPPGGASLTDERIIHLWDSHVGEPTATLPLTDADKTAFARAIEKELRSPAAAAPSTPTLDSSSPTNGASHPMMGESRAPAAAPAPEGYELVMVQNLRPADEPDWDECIRQAEVATGLKVEQHTMSIVIREVRRWLAGRSAKVWHPIETAPKDGTCILAFWTPMNGEKVIGAHYGLTKFYEGYWVCAEDSSIEWTIPTHWMPLPAAPSTATDVKG
jgi:hypothetical protein